MHAGAGYAAWTFADGAVYASPYLTGNEVLLLRDVIRSTAVVATMEAAIGARGPFRGEEYVDALTKHLGAHSATPARHPG